MLLAKLDTAPQAAAEPRERVHRDQPFGESPPLAIAGAVTVQLGVQPIHFVSERVARHRVRKFYSVRARTQADRDG